MRLGSTRQAEPVAAPTAQPDSPRVAAAVAAFDAGYNCCQALLLAWSDRYGLDRDQAVKLGTPFVSGFGYAGEACGAVVGALLVLGLEYGRTEPNDRRTEKDVAALARDFQEAFKHRNEAIACRDLKKLHRAQFVRDLAHGSFRQQSCTKCVRDAAQILEARLPAEGV